MRHITKYSYNHTAPGCFEKDLGSSITVQDDSYTIQEIIDRYTNGIEPPRREPYYFDVPLDQIDSSFKSGFDLNELNEMQRNSTSLTAEIERQEQLLKDQEPK